MDITSVKSYLAVNANSYRAQQKIVGDIVTAGDYDLYKKYKALPGISLPDNEDLVSLAVKNNNYEVYADVLNDNLFTLTHRNIQEWFKEAFSQPTGLVYFLLAIKLKPWLLEKKLFHYAALSSGNPAVVDRFHRLVPDSNYKGTITIDDDLGVKGTYTF